MARSRLGSAAMAAFLASLLIGTIVMFPAWSHHDVRVDSPILAGRAQANAWLRAFEAGEGVRCLNWSVETKVIEQAYDGGTFVQFRCNTERALVRVALGYAVPAVVVLVLAFLLAPRREHAAGRRRKKG